MVMKRFSITLVRCPGREKIDNFRTSTWIEDPTGERYESYDFNCSS